MSKRELRKRVRAEVELPRGWMARVLVYDDAEDYRCHGGPFNNRPFVPWAQALSDIREGQVWDVHQYYPDHVDGTAVRSASGAPRWSLWAPQLVRVGGE